MVNSLSDGLIIAFFTNSISLIIFLIGQIFLFFLIRQYKEFKESLDLVDFSLKHYSNLYTNPLINRKKDDFNLSKEDLEKITEIEKQIYNDASNRLRSSAVRLLIKYNRLNFPPIFPKIPKKNDLHKAYGALIFLSNTTFLGNAVENYEKSKEIHQLLKINFKL